MKTKEELNALKEEVETVSKKLHELTEEELAQVSGGVKLRYERTISHASADVIAAYADLGKVATDSAKAALCDDIKQNAE